MLLPSPSSKIFTSSMAMGFMGIFPGSAQSLISGKAHIVASHRRRRRLDDEADRVHKHVRPVQHRRNLVGAVGVRPWHHLSRLASRHVHRRTIAGDQVSSPENLHQAVGILSPGNAL